MLYVKARAGRSQIHGLGLIAQEFIPKGTRVWAFEPSFDLAFTAEQLEALSTAAREQVLWYAYYDPVHHVYVLSGDDDRFTNHSDQPNTADESLWTYGASYAVRDIRAGEELTWDYRPWSGSDFLKHAAAHIGVPATGSYLSQAGAEQERSTNIFAESANVE